MNATEIRTAKLTLNEIHQEATAQMAETNVHLESIADSLQKLVGMFNRDGALRVDVRQ